MTMRTKSLLQTPATIFILIASLAALAQPAPRIDPATGLPVRAGMPTPVLNPANALTVQAPASVIDPNTGLPAAAPTMPAEPQWIDSNWRDPDIVLTNVSYDGLPLSEVTRNLRDQFKNYFDILPLPQWGATDWSSLTVQLQLRNVKASEIFNAMNLVFENDRTPVRWELKWTGQRPIVQLRALPEGAPEPFPPQPKPPETRRMVYFVGNLLGDEKSGGMTMNQVVKTIQDVWPKEFGNPDGVLQFHNEAQLLIANGTRDQLEFVHQTLAALELKAQLERTRKIEADMKSRTIPPPPKMMPGGDAK